MGRYSKGTSYNHYCTYYPSLGGYYRMSWTVDYYYPSSRLRHPRSFSRDTDSREAAEKFCRKWGIEFPDNAPEK